MNTEYVAQLVNVAKNIKHSGDYGMLGWNEKEKKVFWTMADSDSDDNEDYTSYDTIKIMFESLSFVKSVEVVGESIPTTEGEIDYEDWYNIVFEGNELQYKRY